MSHTTKAAGGTVFTHNGDYSGEVGITVYAPPEELTDGPPFEHRAAWRVTVPFEDLRALVLGYLRDKRISKLEQAEGDELEKLL